MMSRGGVGPEHDAQRWGGLYPRHNFWRVGRKVGRTIYAQVGSEPSDDDPLIGLMDTLYLAEEAVEAHNAGLTQRVSPGPYGRSESVLLPADRIALTIAHAQLGRGENPPINITTVLVMAIERLMMVDVPQHRDTPGSEKSPQILGIEPE